MNDPLADADNEADYSEARSRRRRRPSTEGNGEAMDRGSVSRGCGQTLEHVHSDVSTGVELSVQGPS
eukprot:4559697-Pleurochrysis_carterae.AAC.1